MAFEEVDWIFYRGLVSVRGRPMRRRPEGKDFSDGPGAEKAGGAAPARETRGFAPARRDDRGTAWRIRTGRP
jgi:hypothetical protein